MAARQGLGIVAALLLAGGCTTTTQVRAEQFHLPSGGEAPLGRTAFVELGCARCHEVAGQDDLPRPTVVPKVPVALATKSASRPTDARLVTAIINPSHQISASWREDVQTERGSRMPATNDVMTVKQLLDIVAFLRSAEQQAGG